MNWDRYRHHLLMFLTALAALEGTAGALAASDSPRILGILESGTVLAGWHAQESIVQKGQPIGPWTLMGVIESESHRRLAVFEDFSQTNGHVLFLDKSGVSADLPKSSEPTWADPKTLYRGHRLEEVFNSERDLLARSSLLEGIWPRKSLRIRLGLTKVCSRFPVLLSP